MVRHIHSDGRDTRTQKLRRVLLSERGKASEMMHICSLGLQRCASADPAESTEAAAMELQAGMLASVTESDAGRLAKIDEALDRLEEGQYGICQECGGAIAAQRLAVMPYAALCVRCQREQETAAALHMPVRQPPPVASERETNSYILPKSSLPAHWLAELDDEDE